MKPLPLDSPGGAQETLNGSGATPSAPAQQDIPGCSLRSGNRHAGAIGIVNAANVGAAVACALCIPRWLGPSDFGSFTLTLSLALWFSLAGSFGLRSILGRYLPPMIQESRPPETFLGGLLIVRLGTALVGATLFVLLASAGWLEVPGSAIRVGAALILVRAFTSFCFAVLLGVNQPARWAAEYPLRGWLGLALLGPGYRWGGLGGACGAILVAEVVTAAVGFWWAGRRILPGSESWRQLLSLRPVLRFGLLLCGAEILLMTMPRAGMILVGGVTGDYREVGYFSLAMSIFDVLNFFFGQQMGALTAELTCLRTSRNSAGLADLVQSVMTWVGLGGAFLWLGALFLGRDLAPLVFGRSYTPVGVCFLPLALALLTAPPGRLARVLTVVFDHPGYATQAAALSLGVLAVVAPFGALRHGALGVAAAVLVATCAETAYLLWRLRTSVRVPLRRWTRLAVGALLVSPLAFWKQTAGWNAALFVTAMALYAALILCLGWIPRGEVAAALRHLLPARLQAAIRLPTICD